MFLNPTPISRRACLAASASSLITLGAGRLLSATLPGLSSSLFSDYPFKLGVASGDPTADGFVLWTRLAPKPLEGGGMGPDSVNVLWRVAEDEAMRKIVAQGETLATAGLAHSVHVEVAGLKPDRWYWYVFQAGGELSPKGRTRTLELPNRPAAETPPLKMLFASCQHYEAGYFTAFKHMLAESPDLIFHLGDYIYEKSSTKLAKVRSHAGAAECMSLEDYRTRHAQYKADPLLQALHAAAPWVVTWDDHEVSGNYAGIHSKEDKMDHAEFLKRRAAAYQAYYEHMPLRKTSVPSGPGMQIYRTIHHGNLINFHVLDTRQYRSLQLFDGAVHGVSAAQMQSSRTILGESQRKWLFSELAESRPVWNVLAQQVMMAPIDKVTGEEEGFGMDKWPGYEYERRAVLKTFQDLKVTNPVVLTGDVHSHWANDLTVNPDQPDSAVVASEFVCSSITSKGDGMEHPKKNAILMRENQGLRFHADQRGYVSCRIDSRTWRTDFRNVPYVSRPGAPVTTPASFVLEKDRPGMHSV